jgi:hypothetical protein
MSHPTPKGEARPSPLRPDHRALTNAQRLSSRLRVWRRVWTARARSPLRSRGTRSVPHPSRLGVRPSEEGRGILSFFRIHGRDLTSAIDGVGTIPPHSLAFQPECNPSTATAIRVAPVPWARRRRASEGTGIAIEGNGVGLAELDSTR